MKRTLIVAAAAALLSISAHAQTRANTDVVGVAWKDMQSCLAGTTTHAKAKALGFNFVYNTDFRRNPADTDASPDAKVWNIQGHPAKRDAVDAARVECGKALNTN